MSALGIMGFLSSVWIFSEYASSDPLEESEKKYKSYDTLKHHVYPAVRNADIDQVQESLKTYFSYLKREIYAVDVQ